MKIYFPANIYSALLGILLPDELKTEIEIVASSTIVKKLSEDENSVGLLPACDLIKKPEFYVSNTTAVSFDGPLSQSYLYFVPEQNKFDKILLRGDVSSNEVILSKILFKEQFDLNTEILLDTGELALDEYNYLISGHENNDIMLKNNGVSFADQVAEFIDYPYVNYLLVSLKEENINTVATHLKDADEKIENNILEMMDKINLPVDVAKYITENIDSVYFELTENEIAGIHELLKLPYYHGIVEDMIEIKFI